MDGIFITFEGTDGCGKSTQMRLLEAELKNAGREVVITREPGGCSIAEKIRSILLSDENKNLCCMSELFLYEAARAQHMQQVILPALSEGKIVICDRFIDSTLAYQGVARGLGVEMVEQLNLWAVDGRMPDLTLLLKLPPERAFMRKGGQDEHDRIEQEGNAFFEKVYQGFMTAVDRSNGRIAVIDGSGSKEKTHAAIVKRVKQIGVL